VDSTWQLSYKNFQLSDFHQFPYKKDKLIKKERSHHF